LPIIVTTLLHIINILAKFVRRILPHYGSHEPFGVVLVMFFEIVWFFYKKSPKIGQQVPNSDSKCQFC
jgi:hypothetical protein